MPLLASEYVAREPILCHVAAKSTRNVRAEKLLVEGTAWHSACILWEQSCKVALGRTWKRPHWVMSNRAVINPLEESSPVSDARRQALFSDVFTSEWSLWDSLKENVRSVVKPEKLPPLKLTSRPVKVREIWGQSQRPKTAAVGSLIAHGLFFGLIAFALMQPAKQTPQEPPKQVTHLVAPPLSDYMPMQKDPGPAMTGG